MLINDCYLLLPFTPSFFTISIGSSLPCSLYCCWVSYPIIQTILVRLPFHSNHASPSI
jgi:hypothetical protein